MPRTDGTVISLYPLKIMVKLAVCEFDSAKTP